MLGVQYNISVTQAQVDDSIATPERDVKKPLWLPSYEGPGRNPYKGNRTRGSRKSLQSRSTGFFLSLGTLQCVGSKTLQELTWRLKDAPDMIVFSCNYRSGIGTVVRH